MIGRIQGVIVEKKPPELLIDVNGIGYEVLVPMNTFYQLPDIGQNTLLLTHLLIREEAHTLYGFLTEKERILFRTLIKISGIGPKAALSILSAITVEQFIQSIQNQSTLLLIKVPGVGKKTADRLLLELRNQLPKSLKEIALKNNTALSDIRILSTAQEEALQALVTLGYSEKEAHKKLSRIEDSTTLSCENLIRLALQQK